MLLNYLLQNAPPQKLEIRTPENQRLMTSLVTEQLSEKQGQFLLSLVRAQRGWSANHALRQTGPGRWRLLLKSTLPFCWSGR
jgi:hypothetical protein